MYRSIHKSVSTTWDYIKCLPSISSAAAHPDAEGKACLIATPVLWWYKAPLVYRLTFPGSLLLCSRLRVYLLDFSLLDVFNFNDSIIINDCTKTIRDGWCTSTEYFLSLRWSGPRGVGHTCSQQNSCFRISNLASFLLRPKGMQLSTGRSQEGMLLREPSPRHYESFHFPL